MPNILILFCTKHAKVTKINFLLDVILLSFDLCSLLGGLVDSSLNRSYINANMDLVITK